MDNSIKVKINYHPVNFMQIALWIMLLFAVPCFWLASYSDSFSLLLLGLVAVILTAQKLWCMRMTKSCAGAI